jgi:hypothetical protein
VGMSGQKPHKKQRQICFCEEKSKNFPFQIESMELTGQTVENEVRISAVKKISIFFFLIRNRVHWDDQTNKP